MSLPKSEKTAGADFQQLHLALVPIDKQIADMADFFAMSIDHFPLADVLG